MPKDKKENVLPLFKALGNPVRLDILSFLFSGEKCVCDIFARLDLPQNLVSHHLGILRKNDLIKARKDGKWVHYSVNPASFDALKNFTGEFAAVKNIKCKSNC